MEEQPTIKIQKAQRKLHGEGDHRRREEQVECGEVQRGQQHARGRGEVLADKVGCPRMARLPFAMEGGLFFAGRCAILCLVLLIAVGWALKSCYPLLCDWD
jgi:hypothetical protein